MRHFDLCVIGSGAGGQRAAIQAAKLGKRVCVVERREVVGGAAVNTGTIPSKALREAILQASGCRVAIPGGADLLQVRGLDMPHLMNSCQEVINAEINLLRGHFNSNGIHLINGLGKFKDATTIEVVGEHSAETVQADHTVIAVGTTPAKPSDVPFDADNIITSDELLQLKILPRSMIVVGGGVIGTEYASMLSAIGVKTTLIEGKSRLLDFVDSEILEAFQYHARQGGMTLRMGEKVVKISSIEAPAGARTSDGVMVEAMLESGKTLRADALLYAIGRQGATEGLGLENAGLAADNRGRIKVNERYQTSVPNIYAVGDVIGFPALASTSMEQGRLSACYMFGEQCERMDELLPYGVYTIPEISMVGWTEERLTAEGIPYESGLAQYKEIARGQLMGDDIGMLKMLIHQESHAILGVHAIGTGATELIHIGQTAIAFKATAEHFVNTVFNYPTLAECYKVAALNGLNKLRSV
ncbi:MAG: Si-specific NAD(P)(+) transhydrogenase [Phycisphaerales bacterium]|nr:Si-specific NAD(P)(+) transhydrogenase [Phycisphaerales bacterium]